MEPDGPAEVLDNIALERLDVTIRDAVRTLRAAHAVLQASDDAFAVAIAILEATRTQGGYGESLGQLLEDVRQVRRVHRGE